MRIIRKASVKHVTTAPPESRHLVVVNMQGEDAGLVPSPHAAEVIGRQLIDAANAAAASIADELDWKP